MIESNKFFLKALIRILLVILITLVVFCVGLMIGYAIIGDGESVFDVFKQETWQNIIKFLN